MLNQTQLADKISQKTNLPTDEVKVILKHALKEVCKAFGADGHRDLLILGQSKPINDFISNARTHSSSDRLFLHTNKATNL